MSNQADIKSQMILLDIRPIDFENCSNLEEEFIAIQRKSGDLKAFCDPSEMGYASRIREINTAHRKLKDLFDERKIDSFSQYLRDDQHGDERSDGSEHGSSHDNSSNESVLRFQ